MKNLWLKLNVVVVKHPFLTAWAVTAILFALRIIFFGNPTSIFEDGLLMALLGLLFFVLLTTMFAPIVAICIVVPVSCTLYFTGIVVALCRKMWRHYWSLPAWNNSVDWKRYSWNKHISALRADAERGDANAQYNLCKLFWVGEAVARDMCKMMFWCRKAAEHGHAAAQYSLGLVMQEGPNRAQYLHEGYSASPQPTWKRTVSQKPLYPHLQMYAGHAVAQRFWTYVTSTATMDLRKAARWYLKSAEQGNRKGASSLTAFYLCGLGVAQDHYEACVWWLISNNRYYFSRSNFSALSEDEMRLAQKEAIRRWKDMKHRVAQKSAKETLSAAVSHLPMLRGIIKLQDDTCERGWVYSLTYRDSEPLNAIAEHLLDCTDESKRSLDDHIALLAELEEILDKVYDECSALERQDLDAGTLDLEQRDALESVYNLVLREQFLREEMLDILREREPDLLLKERYPTTTKTTLEALNRPFRF